MSGQLGLTDKQLALLPAESLKKLAVHKHPGTMPDLVHLNSPALQQLKLDLAAMTEAAESLAAFVTLPTAAGGGGATGVAGGEAGTTAIAAAGGGAGARAVAAITGPVLPGAAAVGGAAAEPVGSRSHGKSPPSTSSSTHRWEEYDSVVNMVCRMLKGNTTLRSLVFKGLKAEAAEQLAAAVCDVGCGLQTLQLGAWLLPVGPLLGKQGCSGLLTELDVTSSCRVTSSTTTAAAAAVHAHGAAGSGSFGVLGGAGPLAHRGISRGTGAGGQEEWRGGGGGKGQGVLGVEEALLLRGVLRHCSGLRRLVLGGTEHLPRDVAQGLVDVVMQLPKLQSFNGMPVTAPVGTTMQGKATGGAAAGEPAGAIDRAEGLTPATAARSAGELEGSGVEPLVVDASSWVLGPVGAALLGRSLEHMGSRAVSLRVLDLSGASGAAKELRQTTCC